MSDFQLDYPWLTAMTTGNDGNKISATVNLASCHWLAPLSGGKKTQCTTSAGFIIVDAEFDALENAIRMAVRK